VKKLLFVIFAGFIGLSAIATDTVSDGKVATTVGFVTEQMAPLQDNFPGQSGTKAVTFGTESGQNIPRTVTDTMGTSTSDNSLPTAGAAKTALDAKQDAVPANDSNSVLTYTGVAGNVGSKGVYQDSGTYAEQMDDLVTAETFNSALANGLNNEFICAEYDPAEPDKCWLWEIRALVSTDTNRNLFDKNNLTRIHGWFPKSGDYWRYTVNGYSVRIPCKPNTSYTARYNSNSTQAVLSFASTASDDIPSLSVPVVSCTNSVRQPSPTANTPITFTTGPNDKWLIVQYNVEEPQNTDMANNLTVEENAPTILPAGYTPVEYVQNASDTYVNTGITPDQDDVEMEIRYYCNGLRSNYIFQSRATQGGPQFGFSGNNNGDTLLGNWSSGAQIVSNITRTVGHIYKTNLKVKDGVLTFSVFDETSGQSDIQSKSESFVTPTAPIGIFGNTGGNRIDAGHRVYYAWIKVNGEYVMNYVPAVYNNAAGFYDTVSKTFKGKTSGSLTAGPATNNNLYLPQGE